jgi:serine O-acetyltransferase
VRIGNDVRVGANAVVVDDVPAHCTVVGIPARIVRRRAPDSPVDIPQPSPLVVM